jgi:hypothetical protein
MHVCWWWINYSLSNFNRHCKFFFIVKKEKTPLFCLYKSIAYRHRVASQSHSVRYASQRCQAKSIKKNDEQFRSSTCPARFPATPAFSRARFPAIPSSVSCPVVLVPPSSSVSALTSFHLLPSASASPFCPLPCARTFQSQLRIEARGWPSGAPPPSGPAVTATMQKATAASGRLRIMIEEKRDSRGKTKGRKSWSTRKGSTRWHARISSILQNVFVTSPYDDPLQRYKIHRDAIVDVDVLAVVAASPSKINAWFI